MAWIKEAGSRERERGGGGRKRLDIMVVFTI
jgi:hypothetical protein